MAYVSPIKDNDWKSVRQAINVLARKVGPLADKTFANITITGLTASRLVSTDASKKLSSVSDLTSWIAGTANQITSTSDGDGTLTLSTPQDIATTSSPTWVNNILTGYLNITEISEPASPSANNLRIYSVEDTDFTALEIKDSTEDTYRICQDSFRIARNTSGATIDKGKVIYFTGSTGQKPEFALAKSDSETTMPAIGITIDDVADNGYGRIMIIGRLTGVKTDHAGWAEGDELFVDPSTAGSLTKTRPTHPNLAQWIGTIEIVHATTGVILVNTTGMIGREDGTNRNSFTIGDQQAGAKTVKFDNGSIGTLSWTPSTARTITIPDATGTLALASGAGTDHAGLSNLDYASAGHTGFQAYDAGLTNLAAVAMAADKFYYTSADNVHVAGDVTAFARSILDDADEATFKATVNLEIGTDVLAQQTIGIADDNLLEVDDADAADNDYAKFTANGLEGRSYSEVKTDLSLNLVENTALSTWTGSGNITTVGTIASGTWSSNITGAIIDATSTQAEWDAAYTHVSNDGSDHSFIDQTVTVASSPTHVGLTLSGLTQGSVLFAGASGVISQDNSNLFWDDTNNRLGIGTNTPSKILTVYRSGAESEFRLGGTAASSNAKFSMHGGGVATNNYLQLYNGTHYINMGLLGSEASGSFIIWDASNNQLLKVTQAGKVCAPTSNFNCDSLTATRLCASDASKDIVSTSLSSWLTGTANQVTVTDDGDGTATLSLPQDLDTGTDLQVGTIGIGMAPTSVSFSAKNFVFSNGTTTTPLLQFNNTTVQASLGVDSSHRTVLNTGGGSIYYFATNGTLTIDSTASATFSVDRADSTNYYGVFNFKTAGADNYMLGTVAGSTSFTLYGQTGSPYWTQRLDVDTSGNWQIGTPGSNYTGIAVNGDLSFTGTAGFYLTRLSQAALPTPDTGEFLVHRDSDDDSIRLVYNDTNAGVVQNEMLASGKGFGNGMINLYGWQSTTIAGTWATATTASAIYCHYFRNTSTNDADEINWTCYLAAGTYTIKFLVITDTNCGIADIYIDSTEVASFDCYSGSTVYNVVNTQASISVATSGVKTIKIKVDGKNGSSSDYMIPMQCLSFYRTA